MTVKELIQKLQEYDPELLVGRDDHEWGPLRARKVLLDQADFGSVGAPDIKPALVIL